MATNQESWDRSHYDKNHDLDDILAGLLQMEWKEHSAQQYIRGIKIFGVILNYFKTLNIIIKF